MSVANRLISGTAASWARIAVTMLSQLVLVPVYLIYWDVSTYGIWIAIQALVNVLSMVDFGHQTFLGYEFLRIGTDNRRELSKHLWSGVAIACLVGIIQITALVVFYSMGILPALLGESDVIKENILSQVSTVLLMQSVSWTWVASISGLFTRVLAPFGYFPRVAWWGFLYALVTAFAPLVAVVLGGNLLHAGIAFVGGAVAYSIPMYIDLFRLMKKEGIPISKPSWSTGFSNFYHSLALFTKSLFENIRQQGARLVLAPVAGAAGLAAFSTMRTGANVALQGLNTITNPLMPDLVRFLNERNQQKSEAAFSTVWMVVIGLMAPSIVVLQAFIEPLYVMWTRGKIPFDPPLFAVLSLGVLIYAAVQPALAVVVGHNMLRPQLILSSLAAAIVVGGIVALVPTMGIFGAGIALLSSEIAVAAIYLYHAKKWLRENGLEWPYKAFAKAVTAVVIAGAGMSCMILFPPFGLLTLGVTLALMGWNLIRYWRVLPEVAINQAQRLANKIPVIRTLFTY